VKLLKIISVGFNGTDQYWSAFLHSLDTGEKMRVQWDSTSAIHRLKNVYDSGKREVLYNILIEMKLVRLIKMCLNETYSAVRIGKHLSGMKLLDAFLSLLFNFALDYAIKKV
jgi:hypothetical protein